MKIEYYFDGVPFKGNGSADIIVSASKGLLDLPKPKSRTSVNWPEYHGEVVDLASELYTARTIELSCFSVAENMGDSLSVSEFIKETFSGSGMHRIDIRFMNESTGQYAAFVPYDVYISDGISFSKTFREGKMVMEYTVKLTEPEPVKRVYLKAGLISMQSMFTLRFKTDKSVAIYWGDGHSDVDLVGDVSISHTYAQGFGVYLVAIHGDIDGCTNWSYEGIGSLVWEKLL